ncbi:MAG: hypothetical protein AAGG56_10625 [Pseudomonadota bacterium]
MNLDPFGYSSFQSVWYWVLQFVVWTLVTNRTLGVPHDMLARARRLPDVMQKVEMIATIHAYRATSLVDRTGIPLALFVGFLLSGLFAVGFVSGVEAAQAAFMLLCPLAFVAYSTCSTAVRIKRRGYCGDDLLKILSRRQFWHQVVAAVAVLSTVAAGIVHSSHFVGL